MVKYIATDCDGVLLDWRKGFAHFANDRKNLIPLKNPKGFELHHLYGISKEYAHDLREEFNNSAYIGYLEPYKDALEGVSLLNKLYDYRFIVISHLSLNIYSQQLRIANLCSLFGEDKFLSFELLAFNESKQPSLAALKSTYWVEDKPYNAALGKQVGHTSIHMDHGLIHDELYNEEDIVHTVTSWADILEIVNNDKKR